MAQLETNPPANPLETHPAYKLLVDPEVRKLVHLPMLTLVYLHAQKTVSATPVTPLELAAHLAVDVKIAEGILGLLQQRGLVHPFSGAIAAYYLTRELEEVTLKDLLTLLGDFHRLILNSGHAVLPEAQESQDKYRKIYSELATEILALFGQDSANQLPL